MQTFIVKCCLSRSIGSKKHSMIRFVKHHICGALTTTDDRRPSSWSSFNNSFPQPCGNAHQVYPSVTTGLGYYLTNFISNSIFWLSEKDSYVILRVGATSRFMLVTVLGRWSSVLRVHDVLLVYEVLCFSVSSVVFTLLFVSPGPSLLSSL